VCKTLSEVSHHEDIDYKILPDLPLVKGENRVNSFQPVEKVFFLSLRAKRGNLAFNKINGLEIASSVDATSPQ